MASFESKTLLASAARTAAVATDAQLNKGHRGCHIIIDVTLDGAAASVTPTIQGQDPASGKWYTVLAGSAIAAVGTTVLKVYPGIGAVANGAASDVLPPVWRLSVAVADSDALTYSVGVNLLP